MTIERKAQAAGDAQSATPLNVLLRERIAIDDAGLGNMWPVFYDSALFTRVIEAMAAPLEGLVDKIAGIEARGFLLGAAVATRLRVGFVAIRKADGLYPGETLTAFTAADYRGARHTFRLQRAALAAGERVGLVDDWFETGSQGRIARALLEQAGAIYVGASIIVDQLSGANRDALAPCHSLVAAAELDFPARQEPSTRLLESHGALRGEISIGDDFEFTEAEIDEMLDPPA